MFELGFNETLSKNCIDEMQNERYEIFKSQDLEKGRFDVVFEVEGKKLHAHSFILTSVSEYMDAMLTDRWSKKNEVVKIESYTYDNFYQFLCFLYSGSCNVTSENVFQLVDMAEFFGVSSFKKFCDRVLSVAKNGGKRFLTVENVEELTDLALKYSLKEFVDSIREYVRSDRGNNMFKSESFLAFKKPFIKFLISVDRRDDKFFEAMYKWSENQVKKQNDVDVENFNLLEAVKAEMNKILPQIEFSKMSFKFMKNFVVEKGYFLSPAEFKQYFGRSNSYFFYEEEFVELVYQLAEKQALQKQKMATNDEKFNLADSIKTDLSEVIKTVRFDEIDQEFLTDFVVAKEIITQEQANCIFYTRVQIKNNGKIISGAFKDNLGILDLINKKSSRRKNTSSTVTSKNTTLIRFSNLISNIPKTKSTVKKMKGVEWYLCLDENGVLVFKNHSKVDQKDYLLAEMKSKEEFSLTSDKETSLQAFYNNIPDY